MPWTAGATSADPPVSAALHHSSGLCAQLLGARVTPLSSPPPPPPPSPAWALKDRGGRTKLLGAPRETLPRRGQYTHPQACIQAHEK